MARALLPLFFLVSGFCALVYEVVWLRLAMAAFGVTTQMVSIVLATFMTGLAAGSLLAGAAARRLSNGSPSFPLRLYGLAELVIALSAAAVPPGFAAGRQLLQALSGSASGGIAWASGSYYAASGALVAIVMLPFCVAMGATFPLAMWWMRRADPARSPRSFSLLYAANLVGATAGTLGAAYVLIELLGFSGTLSVAASLNALLAAAALVLSLRTAEEERLGGSSGSSLPEEPAPARTPPAPRGPVLATLFLTGLISMAMEVVWVRQLTPYLGNVVYTFASILAAYLVASWVGAQVYRTRGSSSPPGSWTFAWLVALALLPAVAADPRLALPGAWRVLLGIVPFCALQGYVTPLLVDGASLGDPGIAARAYAVNVLGCIVGPLLVGFVLLPVMPERATLLALALPFVLLAILHAPEGGGAAAWRRAGVAIALAGVATLATRGFESRFPGAVVRRDATATVMAVGEGMNRQLYVNGIGMTFLTPIAKMMAHLPMAALEKTPRRVLVICAGMGTSFRSALSWGAEVTAVELVPSVAALFPWFQPDAGAIVRPGASGASPLLSSGRGRLVVDDGRRFLERGGDSYDVILFDPPPPVAAAGCSLLYSKELYSAVRRRLAPGGIVQQWIPGGEIGVVASFVLAARESFPHVRTFFSQEGWGLHILASEVPIPDLLAATLAARMPEAARRDLVEWGPARTAEEQIQLVLRQAIDPARILARAPGARALVDDHPVNEYFFLRRRLGIARLSD